MKRIVSGLLIAALILIPGLDYFGGVMNAEETLRAGQEVEANDANGLNEETQPAQDEGDESLDPQPAGEEQHTEGVVDQTQDDKAKTVAAQDDNKQKDEVIDAAETVEKRDETAEKTDVMSDPATQDVSNDNTKGDQDLAASERSA